MSFEKMKQEGWIRVKNQGGPDLTMAEDRFIEEDGFLFKDLAGTGKLLPYEDWRLSDEERASDLAPRLSVEEIAGLMQYSRHQMVPAPDKGPFPGHYNGESFEKAGVDASELTDEQKRFLKEDHLRHILLAGVLDVRTSASWSNRMQKQAEKENWGIPVNISSDPRHGVKAGGAEYTSKAGGISTWPSGIGMTAAGGGEIVRKFAEIASKEYRAMGITTALWPQIDRGTEPRWSRLEDTPGPDRETCTEEAKAYCDGLQTTEGSPDGWGKDSVIAMAKHFPGGGPVESGRDAHYPFGAYAVYPGDAFMEHVRVFTEGAFSLDGPTRKAAALMPYYTVSSGFGENVGNSYNTWLIRDFLRGEIGYDGVICTDWGITADPGPEMDSFDSRCFNMESLSEPERQLKIIMNGVDMFGGSDSSATIVEAYRIGAERYGEKTMRKRFEESASRLLLNIFRLGLFEDPYLDVDRSVKLCGNPEFTALGRDTQAASTILLKNKADILPLKRGIRIYVPDRTIREKKGFMRNTEKEKHFSPFSEAEILRLEEQGFCSFVRRPEEADVFLVMLESPLNDGGYKKEEREKTGNGYLPISLQYRPYTAEHARAVSLAGGDFREEGKNRSYLGKTSICPNESDLENVLDAEKSGKPVIAVIRMHNPAVLSELEPHADAILCEFGIETGVLFEILFGERRAGGRLPYHLPKNMQGIEESLEDLADDYEPYRDTEGNCYERGFGLGE